MKMVKYPLDVLEIKCVVSAFDKNQPSCGIHAHFMNLDIKLTKPKYTSGSFDLYKYDKRRNLPFSYI